MQAMANIYICARCTAPNSVMASQCQVCGGTLADARMLRVPARDADRVTTLTIEQNRRYYDGLLAGEFQDFWRPSSHYSKVVTPYLSLCWFCRTRPPDPSSTYQLPVYTANPNAEQVAGLVNYRSATYQTMALPIPRCRPCARRHGERTLLGAPRYNALSEAARWPGYAYLWVLGWQLGDKPVR
jgi:ribosomal protein L40E